MSRNPLQELGTLGQSVWLDYIDRPLIQKGGLQRLIDDDGLRGMTSNPSIFEHAIAQGAAYDDDILTMAKAGKDAGGIYQALSLRDVAGAADLFRPLYDRTDGLDGFVSLEVDPGLAHDTVGTIEEARRLWAALDRPNVMIKVPGTIEGLPAIRLLIGEGINVNVTLLFGVPRYRAVAEAYLAGLEARALAGKPVRHVASVASFFVSRIDTLIDPMLKALATPGSVHADLAAGLQGRIAIDSAKVAYQFFKETFDSDRFHRLAAQGARGQRLLWASTGTKNPEYPDVKYVEALIGPDTVDTIPVETLDAYRDHGDPKARIESEVGHAARDLKALTHLGIDLDAMTRRLEDEGVAKFTEAFARLMEALRTKMGAPRARSG